MGRVGALYTRCTHKAAAPLGVGHGVYVDTVLSRTEHTVCQRTMNLGGQVHRVPFSQAVIPSGSTFEVFRISNELTVSPVYQLSRGIYQYGYWPI